MSIEDVLVVLKRQLVFLDDDRPGHVYDNLAQLIQSLEAGDQYAVQAQRIGMMRKDSFPAYPE